MGVWATRVDQPVKIMDRLGGKKDMHVSSTTRTISFCLPPPPAPAGCAPDSRRLRERAESPLPIVGSGLHWLWGGWMDAGQEGGRCHSVGVCSSSVGRGETPHAFHPLPTHAPMSICWGLDRRRLRKTDALGLAGAGWNESVDPMVWAPCVLPRRRPSSLSVVRAGGESAKGAGVGVWHATLSWPCAARPCGMVVDGCGEQGVTRKCRNQSIVAQSGVSIDRRAADAIDRG